MADQANDSQIESTGGGAAPKKAEPVTPEAAKGMVEGKAKKHLAGLKGEVANDNADAPELTPVQKKALEELKMAKNSEERVKLFAKIADDVGLDPLISLIPELGDAGSSIISGLYLLYEGKKAGIGMSGYLKIIALEAADFAVGAIPVLGDVADYFFKSNKWAAKSFEERTKELAEKARKAGVSEDKIQTLMLSAEKWPQLAGKAVGMYGKYKKSKEDEPTQNNAAAA